MEWTKTVSGELAFAAAAAAYRINGYKLISKNIANHPAQCNYVIMRDLLVNHQERITPEDHASGEIVREHYREMLFSFLAEGLRDFLRDAHLASLRDEITWDSKDIPLIAALPHTYLSETTRKNEREALEKITEKSTAYGIIDHLYKGNVKVIDVVLKSKYHSYAVNVVDDKNHVFFFFTRDRYEVGATEMISGYIKNHFRNTTQLQSVRRVGIHVRDFFED